MFYRECERLANEYPTLKELVCKIDEVLHSIGPSGVFKVEDIASSLSAKLGQVSGIFSLLSESGLVYEEEYIECPCGNLMEHSSYEKAKADQDPFECSQCQIDLTRMRVEKIKVYRTNPDRVRVSEKFRKEEIESRLVVSKSFDEELPQGIIQDPFRYTHLLRYFSCDPQLLKTLPFSGKRVLFILHLLKDLIPLIEAAKHLGLDMRNAIFLYKDYPYPQKKAVKGWLEGEGATVKPRSYISGYLEQLAKSPPDRIGQIVVVEDGGFIVPAIHSTYPRLTEFTLGAVEQTTRGIRNSESWEKQEPENRLKFPVISVATSKLKTEFEPRYIARAAIDNIKRLLPHISLSGKKATLFGCGTIGREIASWLRANGVDVSIFEPDDEKRLWAQQEGFPRPDSRAQAAHNKNFVIGASGNESIDSQVIASLSHGTYVVSVSSELYEIDIDELGRQARGHEVLVNDDGKEIGTTFILPPNDRAIHLLANGYPINFWGFESMPEEASDLILSLILLASAELALGHCPTPGIDSDAVNNIAKEYEVAKKFDEFHRQG